MLVAERDNRVEENMKLVHMVCKKYQRRAMAVGIEYDDLAGFGNIGLVKAADRFQEERGHKFTTYAVPIITGTIRTSIRDEHHGPYIVRAVRDTVVKIKSTEGWQKMSVRELAETFDVKEMYVIEALDYMKEGEALSLNMQVNVEGGREIELGESVGKYWDQSELLVEEFLSTLDEKKRIIVEMTVDGYSQRQISEKVGVSQVQVSRLLKGEIKKRLSEYMTA